MIVKRPFFIRFGKGSAMKYIPELLASQRQYDEKGECRPAQRVAPREHRIMNEHIELQGLTPDNGD
jgi:hypothetical protein